MQLSKLEKEILQSLYDQYQEGAPQDKPKDPDCYLVEVLLEAGDDDPTEEEKEAYQDLVDKDLLNSVDFEPDEEHPNRHVMSFGLSVLKQYPDIIAGKELKSASEAMDALNVKSGKDEEK